MIRPKSALRALVPLAALLVAACAEWPHAQDMGSPFRNGPTLAIVDVALLVNTDKTLGDHVLSLVSGDDCSSIRAQKDGPYCEKREPVGPPPVERPVYCYRTLAAINCFETPAYHGKDHLTGMGFVASTQPR